MECRRAPVQHSALSSQLYDMNNVPKFFHAPSISTLRKYAEAVGCDLVIKLNPKGEVTGV